MSYNSIVTKQDTNTIVTQDVSIDRGADKRSWQMQKGADRQILYQADLDTLALKPFRRKSLTQVGNIKILTGEFSNDTQYPIQKRALSGANDDPAGGE